MIITGADMAKYGYARTSTTEQRAGLDNQIATLNADGCDRVFPEQVSATDMAGRIQWSEMMSQLEPGDVVVITKIDRAARSISDMVDITRAIAKVGASIRILDMNIDTSTPTGTLMLNMFSSVAQFERDMMLERQRVGIAAAKEADKGKPLAERTYKGRTPTARNKLKDVKDLLAAGRTKQEIADTLHIGIASIYRMLKER